MARRGHCVYSRIVTNQDQLAISNSNISQPCLNSVVVVVVFYFYFLFFKALGEFSFVYIYCFYRFGPCPFISLVKY